MKNVKILLAALVGLVLLSCEKEAGEPVEPGFCYECTVTVSTERQDGYAWDVATSVQGHCGITPERAKKIETDGTFKKQQPDQWGIRLIWIDSKTICVRK